MTPERPLVLFGAGRMGGAMLEGWLASGIDPRNILVVEPEPSDTQAMHTPGLRIQAEPPTEPGAALVLAVKPQIIGELIPRLRAARDHGTVAISIAAGTTLATLRGLGDGPLVRAIPNTPSAIGKGMTVAIGEDTGEDDLALADRLLSGIGAVEWVDDEALIDVATAVSGSGPAYMFHFVECLRAAGEAEGLPPDVAATLARQTLIGAGALLERSALDPAELRSNVTSPGGTTAAALAVLREEGGLCALVRRTVHAAVVRSRELGS